MRRILSILLVQIYILCTVSCLAAAQEVQPEPIRKIEKIYFQGNAPVSSGEVKLILRNSGNPDIEKMLHRGKKQKVAGGLLLAGGTLLVLVGISESTKTVAIPTRYGDVYAHSETSEGTPLIVAGVATGLLGCIFVYTGMEQYRNAVDIYNKQVAGVAVTVTLLDYWW